MKLSALYANDADVFPPILFANGFNVVFAQVREPKRSTLDSHNLGKTFLASVLNFALLADLDGDHPFKALPETFGHFVFFLEVHTNSGRFITIRRPVTGRAAISIHVGANGGDDLRESSDEFWTYRNLSLHKAREILDADLNLDAISPYDFRKGIGYFLRKQSDYAEIFRITKFARGKDRDWKPFMAKLLGFDGDLVERKYGLDTTLDELKRQKQLFESEAEFRSAEYDEIRGLIDLRARALEKLNSEASSLDFGAVDARVSSDTVSQLEREIASMNERRYVLEYETSEIEVAGESSIGFDLERVNRVFAEAGVEFPNQLARTYEDLIAFNRSLSAERSQRLRARLREIQAELTRLNLSLAELNQNRDRALTLLKSSSMLEKLRLLQSQIVGAERELAELRAKQTVLNRAADVQGRITESEADLGRIVEEIRKQIRTENRTFDEIRRTFSEFVEEVLSVQALLSVEVNDWGNLEFRVRTLDFARAKRETHEAAGMSYQKILCACFDLALLTVHQDEGFYRFAYHDGIFEGLDNRKKRNLVGLLRRVCTDFQIQHILTVIDSDLPRDEADAKLFFTQEEIVRELHDRGDDGRLFRMAKF
ncbi:MAG TPA: DUF2326 domain-containing protein [Thermoanaerobaculia bacterium]|nr:DUF2326 domain-containing protein [Thermoanaerobaculia bacterium]